MTVDESRMRNCRVCGERVALGAPTCRHCGTRGPTTGATAQKLHEASKVTCALGCLLILLVPVIIVAGGALGVAWDAVFGGG